MTTLIFFADMLRANKLFKSNSEGRPDDLSSFLLSLGGTNFTNCITPGPDTPRSMGIFFTGKLPIESGLNYRSKWPGPNISEAQEALFSEVLGSGVPLRILGSSAQEIGILFPKHLQAYASFFPTLDSLASHRSLDSKDKDVVFIVSKSYHREVDERRAHHSAHRAGATAILKELRAAIDTLRLGVKDNLFLFSDHGCKLSDDSYGEVELLDTDRSQVVFYHSDFTGRAIQQNRNLYSMVDVHQIVKHQIQESSRPLDEKSHALWTPEP